MHQCAGDIVLVQDNRSGRLSYWQGTDHHSVADRYGVSLAPYVHALYGLIVQQHRSQVLIIGCGGGTLATMLSRKGVKVTLLDVDGRSFAIARRYFRMPASVECHAGDGARFLTRNSSRYDAIVVDAFSAGHVPPHFLKEKFFRRAKARLKRGGVVLVNMVVRGDDDPLFAIMARVVGRVWCRPRLLDVKTAGHRNVIAMAGTVKRLKAPRLMVKPTVRARHLSEALAGFSLRPLR